MEVKEKNSGTQVSARQRSSCEAAAGRLLSMGDGSNQGENRLAGEVLQAGKL